MKDLQLNDKIRQIDTQLVSVCKSIKILSELSWEPHHTKEFLSGWEKGNPKLPNILYPKHILTEKKSEIRKIMSACDRTHPIQEFLYQSAESYYFGAELIENLGKPVFAELSIQLYGAPQDLTIGTKISALEASQHFLDVTGNLISLTKVAEHDVCLMAEYVKEEMEKAIKPFFKNHTVEVVIDEKLVSKAAAGAHKIRLRNYTCFAPIDIPQLLEHEAFVHTLTLLNGRAQPNLTTLGLGAPRTTRTQEGLALFAELITNSIDLSRLRRIAARVKGVDMALNGANFIEVFKFFIDCGQTPTECFHSAMRVFRGGDVNGRVAFTKDITYLSGFVQVHRFLEESIQKERILDAHYLFAGRLTTRDVPNLEPFFKSKFLVPPIYEPKWISNPHTLMAFLVYSNFTSQLGLSSKESIG